MRNIMASGGILARLLQDRTGSIAVEIGLIAPVLAVILVPMIDVGMGAYQQMQVQDAAQVGAQYAAEHGWDSAAIENAVHSATGLGGVDASPAPARSCGCLDGTAIAGAACGSTCPDGSPAGTYVTVSAQAQYATFVTYPGLANPLTLSARSTVRIK